MLDRVLGWFSQDIGIDLGTCNTLVTLKNDGIVLQEPSVVAVDGDNEVMRDDQGWAVGDSAKEMLGKTPGTVTAMRPLRDGVIADFDITETMIKYFIQKVHRRRIGIRPRVAISIPTGITGVEERAVKQSAQRAGARNVFLIEEPVAAGIGVGLPIHEPIGNLVVDIGGGTTEVAVISMAGIVAEKSIRVAGDEMDKAIINHLKDTYNLLIGEQTAERIKIEIASAYPQEKEKTMEVKGRDLVAQMPRKVVVTSSEIREALQDPIATIIDAIRLCLEKTPPELSADLVDQGIMLCGGGSLLRKLDKTIEQEIDIPVHIANDPLTAVARGTGIFVKNLDSFKGGLKSGEDIE